MPTNPSSQFVSMFFTYPSKPLPVRHVSPHRAADPLFSSIPIRPLRRQTHARRCGRFRRIGVHLSSVFTDQRFSVRRSGFARIGFRGRPRLIRQQQHVRPVVPAGDRRIHRAAHRAAQQKSRAPCGGHLFRHARSLPGNRHAALLNKRKRQFFQRRRVGHRTETAASYCSRCAAILAASSARACSVSAFSSRRAQRVFQKQNALVQRVQKRHLQNPAAESAAACRESPRPCPRR